MMTSSKEGRGHRSHDRTTQLEGWPSIADTHGLVSLTSRLHRTSRSEMQTLFVSQIAA
jgi:hypothetical protein